MYRKVYIFLLFVLAAEICIAQDVPTSGNCPVVPAKGHEECAGKKSVCWSPGVYDLDCNNGAEVCCFDGCINVCGKPKICKTVTEMRFENATKVMCNKVEQPPVCQTTSIQECKNECKTEEKEVFNIIEAEVCEDVPESVCDTTDTETCITPTLANHTTCPLIHAKPLSECADEPPSNCWSPGVPDLDCENSGLCCFNGCFNRCLKSCYTAFDNVCTNITVPKCVEEPVDACEPGAECREEQSQACVDVTVNKCENVEIPVVRQVVENVCVDKTVPECKELRNRVCTGSKVDSYKPYECKIVKSMDCKDVVVQDCRNVSVSKVDMVEQERCLPEMKPECASIVKVFQKKCEIAVVGESCIKIPKEVCPPCEKKIIQTVSCKEVSRQVCRKENRPVKSVEPHQVCKQVCEPKPVTQCKPVEPKEECNTIVKLMSYPVPVLKCE